VGAKAEAIVVGAASPMGATRRQQVGRRMKGAGSDGYKQ
jgi:hypothetical protein